MHNEAFVARLSWHKGCGLILLGGSEEEEEEEEEEERRWRGWVWKVTVEVVVVAVVVVVVNTAPSLAPSPRRKISIFRPNPQQQVETSPLRIDCPHRVPATTPPAQPSTTHPPTMSTPRRLPLRHARRLITDPPPTPSTDPTLLPLLPGYEQLLSFYAPSLTAGAYTATAQQTVTAPVRSGQTAPDPPLTLTTTQGFSITAPRFALPTGAVHSLYPPQGQGDYVETLPHMVFNDAHLPWEREAT
ncbi:hypothetical protein P167DRAFT_610167, partial [Morchella conica CCBAS932]